jgi:transposase-like protein
VPRSKRRNFARDFRLAALKRMAETDNIHSLPRELGLERKLLYCGRDAFAACGEAGMRRAARTARSLRYAAASDPHEPIMRGGLIQELERKIGQQQLEQDFFPRPCGMSGSNA